jgi:microcystin-dependent protein
MANPFIGEIRMFAGNFAPKDWALCNGQLLPIAENTALFSLLGTTYGGDGESTFALPNLQSRVPIHQGDGAGLSPYVIGENGGAETVTLTVAQIPAHTHSAQASSAGSGSSDPTNNFWASSPAAKQYSPATNAQMASGAMGQTGGNQPHDNMLPFLVVNFIIALFGIFPSRN